mmetsp:Transcript_31376/g.66820  ORF Transcript_31376/g.66820 Transcript_31376/m.66820 type:complete len:89 (+) Transcript_31376:1206-1472(+)
MSRVAGVFVACLGEGWQKGSSPLYFYSAPSFFGNFLASSKSLSIRDIPSHVTSWTYPFAASMRKTCLLESYPPVGHFCLCNCAQYCNR